MKFRPSLESLDGRIVPDATLNPPNVGQPPAAPEPQQPPAPANPPPPSPPGTPPSPERLQYLNDEIARLEQENSGYQATIDANNATIAELDRAIAVAENCIREIWAQLGPGPFPPNDPRLQPIRDLEAQILALRNEIIKLQNENIELIKKQMENLKKITDLLKEKATNDTV